MKTTTPLHSSQYFPEQIEEKFKNFIIEQKHPCIMANTVFSMGDYEIHDYETFGSRTTAKEILKDLKVYLENYNFTDNKFKTFIAVFPNAETVSEIEFENLLWRQLQFIHEKDTDEWDPNVSDDPENSNFSFSIGGRAFYVVGMHPKSSRLARRAPYVTLVFNLHWQFEKLREMGAYHKVRDKIRQRDAALQGNINPVLEDFGESSEARQYSGRNVGEQWKCPFHSAKS
ncbi:guanitoxin biosynthesis heme-dependent pre-guanitoxin N-hydroxylase GntA [Aequorivita sp. SDUM287046]|uniref:Guanitoxin biosynthesis heme-dependent pre-guanitoxin N-hydroxylase GntA n=1 Tax=Aequorivita aurantiaca TaxID=3053356 RepID=A0ABT8DI74_9FLAO|nr:guanitoxin biosynthesis heme-dependent pre-guanitoxin N-hydroxylase GntA [Aequorivita aurantiaca]MDN3725102.1 guanitoxin biosynthesis heme-dependent pre-guanitoxin N-hydroxylase GntA [Aequorivita aurantiaca]